MQTSDCVDDNKLTSVVLKETEVTHLHCEGVSRLNLFAHHVH